MRLEPSDPDIETVVTRIDRGDLDLQPAFQRGDVWSRGKKQRLIDSVLREWHIPPIHVIELRESRKQEVLDGQQRLTAIRDFVRGDFPIDGSIEPIEAEIESLSGKRFIDLPEEWKRRFNQFTLRIFRIVDYRAEEPGELFFRLNQPTSLTAAEQRNAFFGPVRAQIKDLVSHLNENKIDKSVLGFSNVRMAYDDVLARICLSVKRGSLGGKVTAADLIDLYRSEREVPPEVVLKVRNAIDLFGSTRETLENRIQLNKATVYSWFLFAIRANWTTSPLTHEVFGAFITWYEGERLLSGLRSSEDAALSSELFRIYEDRSASRVADVSSVILRDAIIWLGFEAFIGKKRPNIALSLSEIGIHKVHAAAHPPFGLPLEDDAFAQSLLENGWGVLQ